MKDFLKHIIGSKGKMFFLIFVNTVMGLILYTVFGDDELSTSAKWITVAICIFFEYICLLQVWREYKGYEGVFGRNNKTPTPKK